MEDTARRTAAGVTIMIVHGLVLYALAVTAPAFRSSPARVLAARFIDVGPQPPREWQLPAIEITGAPPMIVQPALAIEVPLAPPAAEHAITAVAAPEPSRLLGSGTPKLIADVEYVREPIPRYPAQSKRLREQGVVVLRVLIDEQGSATSVEVESSSGYARLDTAACEAVRRAAFRPYVEDGTPRRALVLIPIEFALNRGRA